MARLTKLLHLHISEVGLARGRQHERRRVLWVCTVLCHHLELCSCPHDPLPLVKFLVCEEAGHTVAHLNQQLTIDVAVVREEEHSDLPLLLCERVDLDVIAKRLPLLSNAIEGECSIKQPVDTRALALEVDPEVRDQHEVALATLDKNCPWHVTTLAQFAVNRKIVLSSHRARLIHAGRRFHFGHAGAQQVLALRQPNATWVRVNERPRWMRARGELVENGGDITLRILEQIVKIPQQWLAACRVLLGLRALIVDLGSEERALAAEAAAAFNLLVRECNDGLRSGSHEDLVILRLACCTAPSQRGLSQLCR
mmetsp:Transcript_59045/g.97651  ORF Transcript_59045/g.97651 Transcript_59045/m.97651 type:complete len:311 (-) Transcript_59045:371-1303(-)